MMMTPRLRRGDVDQGTNNITQFEIDASDVQVTTAPVIFLIIDQGTN